jgi:hypothetical protein
MEFNIKKLIITNFKIELIQDGRNDFRKFHEQIQNANITFTMTNVITVIKIGKSPAKIQQVLPKSDCINDEFYLTYQFSETQTQFRYIGSFEITFLDGSGKLIVPIRENLFINILMVV